MAYVSDVRILTTENWYNELRKFVDSYLTDEDKKYNLLYNADVNICKNKLVYLGWNDVKWYEQSDKFKEVQAILKGLQHLKDNDISYRYSKFGQFYDDYEEEIFDSDYKTKNLPLISYERYFDDNNMLNILNDKAIEL